MAYVFVFFAGWPFGVLVGQGVRRHGLSNIKKWKFWTADFWQ